MSEVLYDVTDGVAVLTLMRGSANALSPQMRAELAVALQRAGDDAQARAIVLTGAGTVFSSGVDISEYDGPLIAPWVSDLTRAIEEHPKPVVAAVHGSALGAGFELALAAHARVAARGTRVALPEVSLGMVPGGGGTQRLPRLIGAQAALEILLSGRAVSVDDPRLALVFAQISDEKPLATAKTLAHRLANAPGGARTRDIVRGFSDPEAYQQSISAVQGQLTDPGRAEADIVRCVEAALLLPFERGLDFEAAVFEARLEADDARGMRHVYAAERRAAQIPQTDAAQPRPVETAVVIGGDVRMAELAVFCLDQGQRVAILSPDEARAAAIAARVRTIYEGAVLRGRLEARTRDTRLARLSHGQDPIVLSAADLVLDSGASDMLRKAIKPGAIWCMMDEFADLRAVGRELGVEVVALRPYRPAHTTPLAELGVAEGTAPDTVATVAQYFGSTGRSVVRVAPVPGLLGHRVMGAGLRAGLALMRAGAKAMDIEAAAKALGFAQGPFEMIELEGIAPVAARLRRLAGDAPELDLLEARAAAVANGATPGQGFYAAEGQALTPDDTLSGWLQAWRAAQDDLPDVPGVSLDTALHAAIVNAAAQAIDAKTVDRASNVDLIFVKGYRFERARGGPLLAADQVGLLGLVRAMKALSPLSGSLWRPAPLIEEMVKYGRRFF